MDYLLFVTPPGCSARWCKIHTDCNPLVTVTTELLLQGKETGKNTSYPGTGNWIQETYLFWILSLVPCVIGGNSLTWPAPRLPPLRREMNRVFPALETSFIFSDGNGQVQD